MELTPAPPPPQPVVVVRLAPVVLEAGEPLELQVERITVESPSLLTSSLASTQPPAEQKRIATSVRKAGKRVTRRARDEAPVPPWLVKRNRR